MQTRISIDVNVGKSFFDVLPGLIGGKKYRRHSWVEGIYIEFNGGQRFVTLTNRFGVKTRWMPYRDDFDGNDWEEVE